ncbi:MAG: hypothetical protein SVR94_15925 [Pseudomonadota bacterium]|nr:hypothetical protein [Pseudomonadota bacterium]
MVRRHIVLTIISFVVIGCSEDGMADGEDMYRGKRYAISETTKSIYPKESNSERYKKCEDIKDWLEGEDADVVILRPDYAGKSLHEEGFQKFLPECDISKYEKSADMFPHRAENEEGKEEVYWTTTGSYYRSKYFEIYKNGIHVLYVGPAYDEKNESKYVKNGRFVVFKPEACETGGTVVEGKPLSVQKGARPSLSNIVKYAGDYYILRVNKLDVKNKSSISIFSVDNNQLGIVCSLEEIK